VGRCPHGVTPSASCCTMPELRRAASVATPRVDRRLRNVYGIRTESLFVRTSAHHGWSLMTPPEPGVSVHAYVVTPRARLPWVRMRACPTSMNHAQRRIVAATRSPALERCRMHLGVLGR